MNLYTGFLFDEPITIISHLQGGTLADHIILVDENDNEIGTADKLEAHQKKILHRALSILIFNLKGEMLLQQRASTKYHSPLLWSNACCTHPRPGESVFDAANRRLEEELGFVCDLEEIASFVYQAEVGAGLFEYELDHILIGSFDGQIRFNSEEVIDVRWISPEALADQICRKPGQYTEWFKIIFMRFMANDFSA